MSLRFCLALACLMLGCGSATVEAPASVEETPAESLAAQASPSEPVATQTLLPGQIRRSDLVRVLSRGPARLLAKVVTEPVMEKGAFVGFRIQRFIGEPPTVPALLPGDVLLLLNGQKVERPEQFFSALEALRTAARLEVTVLRAGQRVLLGYDIVD